MPRAYIEMIFSSKPETAAGTWRSAADRRSTADPGNLEGDLAGLGQHLLLAIAVAAIGPAIRRAGVQVMIHLRVQHPLGQRLLQLVQQAVLLERDLRVRAGQQLVEKTE